ncbi:MAG: putative toxin-antitoxin system toxin component, PIN family [Pseudomonadota bacterium]|nr:putative toxin-antitoxin system toxin component, PIN family [Pseudomonadota bacterium]
MTPTPLVIDTNCVLDVWVFQDPAAAALRHALLAQRVRWLATAAMRAELARVLGYPQIAKRLAPHGPPAREVLAAFDRHAMLTGPAPSTPVRCRDPDDQCFIDLAVAHRAQLISKDARVTGLARRLAPLGVRVQRVWTPVANT